MGGGKKKTSLYEVEDHRFGGNAVNNAPEVPDSISSSP